MSEISIEYLSDKFESHLDVDGNKRTIFSGKFGTGKTYFLNKFFNERKQKYNTITISPVNYVVSSNEDIFELIKADIVNDLFFTGKLKFTKGQKTKLFERLFLFFGEKPEAVVKFVSSLLSKVDPLFEFTDAYLKAVKELKDSFKNYGKELNNKEKSRHEELAEFCEGFEEKTGSIYEHNYITKVINTFLSELKCDSKGSKNVLVIDDLDRIDPEHIFRILNLLSAHNNHFNQENKFVFDHIIIVCDLDNIEKIFHHKYGVGVDFDGYIDKFFSTEIFSINNDDALLIYVDSLDAKLKFSIGERQFILFLLKYFVSQNIVTIRKLMKINFPIFVKSFKIDELDQIDPRYYGIAGFGFITPNSKLFVDSSDLSILKILVFFSRVFGSLKKFQVVIQELSLSKKSEQFNARVYLDMCSYLALQRHVASTLGEDLYIRKEIRYDDFREQDIIYKINWPQCQIFGLEFTLNTFWTNGNPYKGEVSYFSNARSVISSMSITDESLLTLNKEVFKVVDEVINNCIKNKFLTHLIL